MFLSRRSLFLAAAAAPVVIGATAEAAPPDSEPELILPKKKLITPNVARGYEITVFVHAPDFGVNLVGRVRNLETRRDCDWIYGSEFYGERRHYAPGLVTESFSLEADLLRSEPI